MLTSLPAMKNISKIIQNESSMVPSWITWNCVHRTIFSGMSESHFECKTLKQTLSHSSMRLILQQNLSPKQANYQEYKYFSAPSIQQLKQEKLSAWKASNRARITKVFCNPLHSNSLKGLLNSWPWETKNKWWMKIKYFWGQHQHTLPALGTDLPRLQVSGSPENWKYRNVEFGQCFDSKPS